MSALSATAGSSASPKRGSGVSTSCMYAPSPLDHTHPYTTTFTPTITAAFLNGSLVIAEPAPSASSIVVMAKLPGGIWWPALLVPRVEYEYRIKYHGSKEEKAAARHLRSHGVRLWGCIGNGEVAPPVCVCSELSHGHVFPIQGKPEKTMVVLLCHVAITGVHDYFMAKGCYRITYQELEELYYFSLVRTCRVCSHTCSCPQSNITPPYRLARGPESQTLSAPTHASSASHSSRLSSRTAFALRWRSPSPLTASYPSSSAAC